MPDRIVKSPSQARSASKTDAKREAAIADSAIAAALAAIPAGYLRQMAGNLAI